MWNCVSIVVSSCGACLFSQNVQYLAGLRPIRPQFRSKKSSKHWRKKARWVAKRHQCTANSWLCHADKVQHRFDANATLKIYETLHLALVNHWNKPLDSAMLHEGSENNAVNNKQIKLNEFDNFYFIHPDVQEEPHPIVLAHPRCLSSRLWAIERACWWQKQILVVISRLFPPVDLLSKSL